MPDKDPGALEILPELRDKDAASITDASGYPEELRGKTPEELEKFLSVLDAHLRSIHQTDEGELRDKTAAEQKAFAYGLKLRDLAITRIEEDRAVREVFSRRPKAVQVAIAANAYDQPNDPFGAVRRMTVPEARDARAAGPGRPERLRAPAVRPEGRDRQAGPQVHGHRPAHPGHRERRLPVGVDEAGHPAAADPERGGEPRGPGVPGIPGHVGRHDHRRRVRDSRVHRPVDHPDGAGDG